MGETVEEIQYMKLRGIGVEFIDLMSMDIIKLNVILMERGVEQERNSASMQKLEQDTNGKGI